MSRLRFAMIADDLTGAADSGVQLARFGYRTAVFFQGEPVDSTCLDAVVLDTDSRALPPVAAWKRVVEAGDATWSAELVYKKVDSTLRGNVREEIEGAMQATGREKVVIAPAFPGGGRTTVCGTQLLHGRPVHRTEVATDPRTPVRESHLPTLLSGLEPIGKLGVADLAKTSMVRRTLDDSRCVVADATDDGHLRALVEAVTEPTEVLWVGSAGLAWALGEAYPGGRSLQPLPGASRNALVVVGSLSRASREQLQALVERYGVQEVELREAASASEDEPDVGAAIREAMPALARGESLVLCSAPHAKKLAPEGVSEGLAGVVAGLAPGTFDALVLTGGDTAAAVARRLGATGIELLGEVEPGVPVGRLLGPRPYPVVTKAGGFGGRDTLRNAITTLIQVG